MTAKGGVFEQDLGEMLELNEGLDVNSILESIPAVGDVTKDLSNKKDDKNKDDKKPSLLENIDKVLEKQSTEIDKDEKAVDEVVEELKKTDDNAPASLNKTAAAADDAPFTVIFARDLVTQGLLSSFDEKKFTEDLKSLGEATALRNLIKTEIDTNIEAAKSDLDVGYKEYLDLIGKGVPAESAGDLLTLKNRFDSIKSEELVKEENVDLRRQVLTDYFKLTTQMSDAKIEKTIQSSIDLGEDIEESKEYLTKLKGLVKDELATEEQEAQRILKLQEEENRRSLESLRDGINSMGEIIPGVQINKQTKVKMLEDITKSVQDNKGRTTNAIWAKRAEDPMFFDSRVAYLLETGYFDKDRPWNKASQAKVTSEISDLERALKDKSNTASKTGAHVLRSAEEDKTSKDNIESMRGIFG